MRCMIQMGRNKQMNGRRNGLTLILGVPEVGIVIRDSNETVLNFQIFPDGGPCQIALPRVDG